MLEPPTAGQGTRRVWSDSRGRIWSSQWNAGQVAVYDPATGAGRSGGCPATRPQAYAVFVDDRDVVWLSDFGANALVRFDPATAGVHVAPAPERPGQRPPDPRPARRGMGRGVGGRQAGGRAHLTGSAGANAARRRSKWQTRSSEGQLRQERPSCAHPSYSASPTLSGGSGWE